MVKSYSIKQEIIESNEIHQYIIWHLFGQSGNVYIDTYFLFGEKNGVASNFSIMKTDKWTKEQKIAFLKEIFLTQ